MKNWKRLIPESRAWYILAAIILVLAATYDLKTALIALVVFTFLIVNHRIVVPALVSRINGKQ